MFSRPGAKRIFLIQPRLVGVVLKVKNNKQKIFKTHVHVKKKKIIHFLREIHFSSNHKEFLKFLCFYADKLS